MAQVVARRVRRSPALYVRYKNGQGPAGRRSGSSASLGNPVRDVGEFDLVLGSDESLGHGSARRPGRRGPPSAVGQAHPAKTVASKPICASAGKSWVAAGKYQAESGQSSTGPTSSPGVVSDPSATCPQEFRAPRELSTEMIDGSISSGPFVDPAAGVRRQGRRPATSPQREGQTPPGPASSGRGSMSAKMADQEWPPTDRTPRGRSGRSAHRRRWARSSRRPWSTNGQTSIGDEMSLVTFDAQPSASS